VEKEIEEIFTEDAISYLKNIIKETKGVEVFFAGYFDENKQKIDKIEAITFGNFELTPVFLTKAYACDVVIHNHPDSNLTPSNSDLLVAESLMNYAGISSVIIDNNVTKARIIFFYPLIRKEKEKLNKDEIINYFKKDGILSKIDSSFKERPSQIKMAEAVIECFNNTKKIAIEAPTGTGKSLAYLIPSIFWSVKNREKVIISTYTKNLQHQLLEKDLAFLEKCIPFRFTYSIIKGRNNYLCKNKLEEAKKEKEGLFDNKNIYSEIEEWAKTSNGDLEELPFQIVSSVYQDINSSPETCLYKKCKHFQSCFYNIAKQKAFSSDIIISNHSLTILSLIFDEKEMPFLLPKTNNIIFDEAHNLKKVSYLALEESITSNTIKNKLNYLYYEGEKKSGKLKTLLEITEEKEIINELIENIKITRPKITSALNSIYNIIAEKAQNEKTKIRIKDPIIEKSLFEEIESPVLFISNQIIKTIKEIKNKDATIEEKRPLLLKQIENTAINLLAGLELFRILFLGTPDDYVGWVEIDKIKSFFAIYKVPIDPFSLISGLNNEEKTIIFCSATLTIENDFSKFKEDLKIDFETLILPHVFNYDSQVKILIPEDIYYSEDITEQQLYLIKEAIEITEGGTLILCTSFLQVNKLKEFLRENIKYPILVQQEESKTLIIEKFRKYNSVLIGVDSFWEGIDIKGESLRNLIILKLPFSPPNSPIQQAVYEIAEKEGKNSFLTISLPEAIIKFKQGFGRLIRSIKDRGTVIILDPRVIKKSYGIKFLNSIPSTIKNTTIASSSKVLKELAIFHTQKIQLC